MINTGETAQRYGLTRKYRICIINYVYVNKDFLSIYYVLRYLLGAKNTAKNSIL